MSFSKLDRVVVRITKNEWYTGTVQSATPKAIKIVFDDGLKATVEPADFKHVRLMTIKHKGKAALSDIAAKELFKARTIAEDKRHIRKQTDRLIRKTVKKVVEEHLNKPARPTGPPKLTIVPSSMTKLKTALVFIPPPIDTDYDTAFKLMKKWINQVASHYKMSAEVVETKKKRGTVSIQRTFEKKGGDTRIKYERAVKELLLAFTSSKYWRTQVMAGSTQFYSHDGVYHAAFYNIQEPMSSTSTARQIGMYIMRKVG